MLLAGNPNPVLAPLPHPLRPATATKSRGAADPGWARAQDAAVECGWQRACLPSHSHQAIGGSQYPRRGPAPISRDAPKPPPLQRRLTSTLHSPLPAFTSPPQTCPFVFRSLSPIPTRPSYTLPCIHTSPLSFIFREQPGPRRTPSFSPASADPSSISISSHPEGNHRPCPAHAGPPPSGPTRP